MPSEIDETDNGSSVEPQTESDYTLLYNTRQEEINDCTQDSVENENAINATTTTTTRNDNYVYNNVAETRNLDNALLSLDQKLIIMENGSRSACNNETNVVKAMEKDLENNVKNKTETQSCSNSQNETLSTTMDNTTQTSLQDTIPDTNSSQNSLKIESNKKHVTRYVAESNVNNPDSSQSTSNNNNLLNSNGLNENKKIGNSSEASAASTSSSLHPQSTTIDALFEEGTSTFEDDIVLVDRNKPFKLPSLVNLYEAAEAQRAELENNDDIDNSTIDIDSDLLLTANNTTNNSNAEPQQPVDLRRNKKTTRNNDDHVNCDGAEYYQLWRSTGGVSSSNTVYDTLYPNPPPLPPKAIHKPFHRTSVPLKLLRRHAQKLPDMQQRPEDCFNFEIVDVDETANLEVF